MKYFLFQGSGVEKQKGETFCVWPLQLYWNDKITGNIYEHVDLSDNSNRSQVNKEGKVENWREKQTTKWEEEKTETAKDKKVDKKEKKSDTGYVQEKSRFWRQSYLLCVKLFLQAGLATSSEVQLVKLDQGRIQVFVMKHCLFEDCIKRFAKSC